MFQVWIEKQHFVRQAIGIGASVYFLKRTVREFCTENPLDGRFCIGTPLDGRGWVSEVDRADRVRRGRRPRVQVSSSHTITRPPCYHTIT